MSLFSIELFYAFAGLILGFVAVSSFCNRSDPRAWGAATFWGLMAIIYLFGKKLAPALVGWLLLTMVVLAALKRVGRPVERTTSPVERKASADRLQNKLFLPALLIPGTAVIGTL